MAPRVGAVVLAAGESRRFGRPKLQLSYRGVPLVRRSVDAASGGGCTDVVVVVGAASGDVAAALDGTPAQIRLNPHYKEGMSASIRAGIEGLPADCAAAVILLADQPRIDAAVVRMLLDTYRTSGKRIVAARYGEVTGAPVLFDRAFFLQLLVLEGDHGAREVMELHPNEVAAVVIPAELGLDVDRPEDAETLLEDG